MKDAPITHQVWVASKWIFGLCPCSQVLAWLLRHPVFVSCERDFFLKCSEMKTNNQILNQEFREPLMCSLTFTYAGAEQRRA
jgi:hypothetical protein